MLARKALFPAVTAAVLSGALVLGNAHAFTAQLLIDGFEFFTNIGVVTAAGDGDTVVYDVPEDKIAVITDVYFTTTASSPQGVTLKNDAADNVAGPFLLLPQLGFISKGYTSGLIFIEGQDIIVQNEGPEPVTVNLVGYLVCRESCD